MLKSDNEFYLDLMDKKNLKLTFLRVNALNCCGAIPLSLLSFILRGRILSVH